MKNMIELLLVLIEKIPRKLGIAILTFIIIVGACAFFYMSGIYSKWIHEADWRIDLMESEEKYVSDIELKAGDIIARPQLVVEYKQKIVFILNITEYYESDKALISNEKTKDGITSAFILKIADGQKENFESLKNAFEEALREEIKSDKINFVDIYETRVAQINYQNKGGIKRKKRYLLKSSKDIGLITEKELIEKTSDVFFSMLDYSEDGMVDMNKEFKKNVEDCAEIIRNSKD